MNYLAHAFLSFGDSEIVTGNLIADYVKGRNALAFFPKKIEMGILLHREIDRFTDEHKAAKHAASFFKENYGRYAPAIVDSLFDHYLANDLLLFPSKEKLFDFSQKTYTQLELHTEHFPEQFAGMFPHMKEHNWLYNYHSLQGINGSLNGLHRRAKFMPSPEIAYEIFIDNYDALNEAYDLLMLELISFVRKYFVRML